MRRLLAILAVVMAAGVAWGAPSVRDSRGGADNYQYRVDFDDTTADSPPMEVFGLCSVRFTLGSGDSGTATLYECDGSNDATSACTSETSFTSSTATPYIFTPGQRWLKVAASGTTLDDSSMVIDCTRNQLSRPDVNPNVATDLDGDGDPDYVVVDGDYNQNGVIEPLDIQEAINDLTDSDSKTTVWVLAGTYDVANESGSPDAMIVGKRDMTVALDDGVVIQGYDDTALSARSSNTFLFTTESTKDPSDRTSNGDGLGSAGSRLIGTGGGTLKYDLPDSYGTSGWSNTNAFGWYVQGGTATTALIAMDIERTIHSAAYCRSCVDTVIDHVDFGDGVGSYDDTDLSNPQHAVYLFASEATDSSGVVVSNNTCIEAGGQCYHARAEFTCTGGTNDGTVCETDGSPGCTGGGTCHQTRIRDSRWVNNTGAGSRDASMGLLSVDGATVAGNTLDGGQDVAISLGADLGTLDGCTGTNPAANAVCNVVIAQNTLESDTSGGLEALLIDGDPENIVFDSNTITEAGNRCIRLITPFTGPVQVSNNTASNCTLNNSSEFLFVNGSDASTDLKVFLNTLDGIGNDVGSIVDIDAVVTDPEIWGNTFASSASAQECLDWDATPVNALVFGNECTGHTSMSLATEAIVEAMRVGSYVEDNDPPTATTDGATTECNLGALWDDDGTIYVGSDNVAGNTWDAIN